MKIETTVMFEYDVKSLNESFEVKLDRIPAVGEIVKFDDKEYVVRSVKNEITKGPSGTLYGFNNITLYCRHLPENEPSKTNGPLEAILTGEEIVWLMGILTSSAVISRISDTRMSAVVLNKLIG